MSDMSGQTSTTTNPGRVFSIIGIVCGVVSLLFIPILFGLAGAVLGGVGYSKGDKPMGLYVAIGSLVAMVVGIVLGAVVFNATRS